MDKFFKINPTHKWDNIVQINSNLFVFTDGWDGSETRIDASSIRQAVRTLWENDIKFGNFSEDENPFEKELAGWKKH